MLIRKIWTETLIKPPWDPTVIAGFTIMLWKVASIETYSENFNEFSTILQDYFSLVSLVVVDQIEKC